MKIKEFNIAIDKKLLQKAKAKVESISLIEVGDFCAGLIRKRTRLGYGLKDNLGQKERLAGLADSTIKSRDYAKKRGELYDLTTPKKSNLTRTGQLLDSISYKTMQKKLILFFKGRRTDGLRNDEVASYVSERRPFFFLSAQEVEQIKRFIRKLIRK